VIGRRVSPAWAASLANDSGPVKLSGDEALSMLLAGAASLLLRRTRNSSVFAQ
jgi:hypothetical protein